MDFYYNEEVKLLLNKSNDEVEVKYNGHNTSFLLPLIGPRPPFYVHPIYEPYDPII